MDVVWGGRFTRCSKYRQRSFSGENVTVLNRIVPSVRVSTIEMKNFPLCFEPRATSIERHLVEQGFT
jgi:hypothetical protein